MRIQCVKTAHVKCWNNASYSLRTVCFNCSYHCFLLETSPKLELQSLQQLPDTSTNPFQKVGNRLQWPSDLGFPESLVYRCITVRGSPKSCQTPTQSAHTSVLTSPSRLITQGHHAALETVGHILSIVLYLMTLNDYQNILCCLWSCIWQCKSL